MCLWIGDRNVKRILDALVLSFRRISKRFTGNSSLLATPHVIGLVRLKAARSLSAALFSVPSRLPTSSLSRREGRGSRGGG